MKRSTVSPVLASIIARRDGYRCIAPAVDGKSGWCRDQWGNVITRWPSRLIDREKITIAHVKDANSQSMGLRAPSDALHLLLLCWGHHLGTGPAGTVWGTSDEGLAHQRRYLSQFAPKPKEDDR